MNDMTLKMTKNRLKILEILGSEIDDCGGYPPYPTSSVIYELEAMGIKVSKQHVHKTLRDLWQAGLIVANREKNTYVNNLPQWERLFQLSVDVERNALISECSRIFSKIKRAKNGVAMFDLVLDWGMPEDEVPALTKHVKVLLQRTHPDKQQGFEEQFYQLTQCMSWIRDGIPLPTDPAPEHSAIVRRLG